MLDVERARELARQAVELKGEKYIYKPGAEGCMYQQNDAPSCLVGHVLHLDGWTGHQLRLLDEWSEGEFSVPGTNADDLWKRFPDRVSHEAAQWLQWVQLEQDDGKTWGFAIEHADNMMFSKPDEEFPHD